MRLALATADLQHRKGELQELLDQLSQCQEQTRVARLDYRVKTAELDQARRKTVARNAELATSLAELKLREEDLAAARKRQAAITKERAELNKALAPLLALRKTVADRDKELAALGKRLPSLDAELVKKRGQVAAVSKQIAVVDARLAGFVALRQQIQAALQAAGQPIAPPAKASKKPAASKPSASKPAKKK